MQNNDFDFERLDESIRQAILALYDISEKIKEYLSLCNKTALYKRKGNVLAPEFPKAELKGVDKK